MLPEDEADDPAGDHYYSADPNKETPFTLVCYYGKWRLPGITPAVLLLPLPAGTAYACKTHIPRPVRGECVPRRD